MKDYAGADRIRDELRAKGIEPDKLRPDTFKNPMVTQPGAAGLSAEVEALLDDWVKAKRQKDFRKADMIREAAGLKWRRPFHRTAPHWPLCLLWRLRAGRSNPKLPPSGSDPKEAAWKAAGQGPQKEPSPL